MGWVLMMAEWHLVELPFELEDPGTCSLSLSLPEGPVDVILLQWQGSFLAYRNRCPHTGVNLEWQPHRFLDLSKQYLQCATHGALFRPQDGFCVRGPCSGQQLTHIPLREDRQGIWLQM
jgi:nitrite reductase/ring-hydroxylating ferredoxin subunit